MSDKQKLILKCDIVCDVDDDSDENDSDDNNDDDESSLDNQELHFGTTV